MGKEADALSLRGLAFLAWKSLMRVIVADSQVSPVSALSANQSTAIRYRLYVSIKRIQEEVNNHTLPVMVVKRVSTFFENLFFWYSFISTT